MNYKKRVALLVSVDISIVWLGFFLAYFVTGTDVIGDRWSHGFMFLLVSTVVFPAVMFRFKLYNRIWQYASVGELVSIFKASTIACLISYTIATICTNVMFPVSMTLMMYQTVLLLMGGVRFVWRVYRDSYLARNKVQRRTLIIGAGDCGMIIAKELMFDRTAQMSPVAFIDDDPAKHHHQVLGLPVVGGRNHIVGAVEQYAIEDIVIALPSASKKDVSSIIEACKLTKAKLKIIPRIGDLINGKITINEIRDVEVDDLLGREPIKTDLQGIADYIEDKIILVTGAGGSIGSELCRQLSTFRPKKILLLGHGENSIYTIETELREKFRDLSLETIIADVQDRSRIEDVFRNFSPQIVFHAAAHKHVPLMEKNPSEAIKNNVFGTKNVADCADRYGAERFVLISTDKAVNPTSVMGTTKRVAEMYIQSLNTYSRTKFAAVRFGNVLGSRGSVIPKFKEQIRKGGPVTVTHPDMIRYFMTIPEAVQLVIQAGAFLEGGEVFILDMGEPVKILELAKDLIRLSGFEPNVDIEIAYSGIRPGEKLFEELLTEEEGLTSTKHDRIFIGKPMTLLKNEMEQQMKRMEATVGQDSDIIRSMLQTIVPSYSQPDKVKDLSLV
ncbi:polysaccharide biosynthesis protein [Paenibacillus flagellatus]|uniref:Polysaccharide biosynthesis protein n=1 Tax=Paenibacillus flagellatus TaxID=2211139 RepID=A0A2V5KG39_9BACL|nr:nucleoside-diphosphate sugar epimerase/dehydratase [Paenibacillus flagellatus]PYI57203.1 polysaccharide biosynthesis protein [Paenibacillus flagellatus]